MGGASGRQQKGASRARGHTGLCKPAAFAIAFLCAAFEEVLFALARLPGDQMSLRMRAFIPRAIASATIEAGDGAGDGADDGSNENYAAIS